MTKTEKETMEMINKIVSESQKHRLTDQQEKELIILENEVKDLFDTLNILCDLKTEIECNDQLKEIAQEAKAIFNFAKAKRTGEAYIYTLENIKEQIKLRINDKQQRLLN